jgi:hypothetical protein
MQSTTRMTSALALWVVSMAIFIFSSPSHVRAVKAFTIQTNSIHPRSIRTPFSHSSRPSSDLLTLNAAEITGVTTEQSLLKVPNKINSKESKRQLQLRKSAWIEKSVKYYSTVMRNDRRRQKGQFKPSDLSLETHRNNLLTAKKLYHARNKIQIGELTHAEFIYRKLINDMFQEEKDGEDCDHAQLAVSTLLLALLLQRQQDPEQVRDVFVNFFTYIHRREDDGLLECTCCAKVMQAFALFEMKQGNKKKSYRLARMAVQMDEDLSGLLNWKQFRDVEEEVKSSWRLKIENENC